MGRKDFQLIRSTKEEKLFVLLFVYILHVISLESNNRLS